MKQLYYLINCQASGLEKELTTTKILFFKESNQSCIHIIRELTEQSKVCSYLFSLSVTKY